MKIKVIEEKIKVLYLYFCKILIILLAAKENPVTAKGITIISLIIDICNLYFEFLRIKSRYFEYCR